MESCHRCGQPGHWRAECPQLDPQPLTVQAAPRLQIDIECPVCHRDWMSTSELITTPLCPWCRVFEIRSDGQTYRKEPVGITDRYYPKPSVSVE